MLHHVFSDEHTDAPLNQGVMNRDKIGEFLRTLVPAQRIDHAFVCGPYQMNDEAEAALLARRRATRSASTSSASASRRRPRKPWAR